MNTIEVVTLQGLFIATVIILPVAFDTVGYGHYYCFISNSY